METGDRGETAFGLGRTKPTSRPAPRVPPPERIGAALVAVLLLVSVARAVDVTLGTPLASNDWSAIYRSLNWYRFVDSLTEYENMRVLNRGMLALSFTLFGDNAIPPAALLALIDMAAVPLMAGVVVRLGFERRAGWFAGVATVVSPANASSVLWLSEREASTGRTLVLLFLYSALSRNPRVRILAFPVLLLAIVSHETGVLALPMFYVCRALAPAPDCRVSLASRGERALLAWATLLTATRGAVFLAAVSGAEAPPHGMSLAASVVAGGVAHFYQGIRDFWVAPRVVACVVAGAVLMYRRTRRAAPHGRDLTGGATIAGPGEAVARAWGLGAALAIIGYGPHFAFGSYSASYFLTLASAGLALPLAVTIDAAARHSGRPCVDAALAVAGAAVIALTVRVTPPAQLACQTWFVDEVKAAAAAAIERAPRARARTLWLVGESVPVILDGQHAARAVDVAYTRSFMLDLLFPEQPFEFVETTPNDGRFRPRPGDAVLRMGDATSDACR